MTSLQGALAGIALAAAAGGAHAQAPADQADSEPCTEAAPCPPPPGPPAAATMTGPHIPPAPVEPQVVERPWFGIRGFGLSLGGGVTGFVNPVVHDTTSPGATWNGRFTWGTHSYLAIEGGYVGSTVSIQRPGLLQPSRLISNGVEGDLRLNMLTDSWIQPFLFGGVGYRFYSLMTSGTNGSDLANNANVVEIPAGVGFAFYVHHLMLDVRGDYRWAWGERIVPDTGTQTGNGLNAWDVTANIGIDF